MLKEFLFPALCIHCDALLDDASTFLCKPCASMLPWLDVEGRCPRCFFLTCQCAALRFPFYRRIAVFSYGGPAELLINKFKFQAMESLAELFASCLIVQMEKAKMPWPDLIVPIPHAPWHSLIRGYKSSELLARALAKKMDRPVVYALQRSLLSMPQRCKTNTEKISSVKQTYRLRKEVKLADRSILLLDDVATTGQTLIRCSEILREGFPSRLSACTLSLIDPN